MKDALYIMSGSSMVYVGQLLHMSKVTLQAIGGLGDGLVVFEGKQILLVTQKAVHGSAKLLMCPALFSGDGVGGLFVQEVPIALHIRLESCME